MPLTLHHLTSANQFINMEHGRVTQYYKKVWRDRITVENFMIFTLCNNNSFAYRMLY